MVFHANGGLGKIETATTERLRPFGLESSEQIIAGFLQEKPTMSKWA